MEQFDRETTQLRYGLAAGAAARGIMGDVVRMSSGGVDDLDARIEALEAQCADFNCAGAEHRTELRKRVFSNGSVHFVQQCTRCGEQVGGPVKRPPLAPPPFDTTIEDRRNELSSTLSQLRARKAAATPLDPSDPVALREARRHAAAESINALLSQTTDDLGEEGALLLCMQQVWKRQESRRQALAASTDRFHSEPELHAWVEKYLSEDFVLHHEVHGRHLAEQVGVRIDFIAYPKAHLVQLGFEDSPFGIEVKFIDPMKNFTRQASRAFWQTITYTDSEFYVDGKSVRPRYAVLLSNMAFDAERALLKSEDVQQWHAFVNLAHHSRAWRLEVRGTRASFGGWTMMFSSNAYFYRRNDFGRYGSGQVIYSKPNATKIRDMPRVGSF